MLKKIRHMLTQQEGFTLMELMIVVVIIGILAGIAIPTYRGMEGRARKAVGDANAEMLNRGIQQLEYFGDLTKNGGSGVYDPQKHESDLLRFLGMEQGDKIKYVEWDGDAAQYVGTADKNAEIGIPVIEKPVE